MSMRENKAKPAGSATLTYKDKSYNLPAFKGSLGPDVVDIRKLYGDADIFTYDRASLDGQLRKHDHLHRRRQGHSSLSRLSDRPAGREIEFPRSLLSAALRGIAQQRSNGGVRSRHHQPHDAARTAGAVLPWLPARCASNGGDVRRGRGAFGFYHDSTDINDPRQREIASHRLIAKMPRSRRWPTNIPWVSPSSIRRTRWATPRISCA